MTAVGLQSNFSIEKDMPLPLRRIPLPTVAIILTRIWGYTILTQDITTPIRVGS